MKQIINIVLFTTAPSVVLAEDQQSAGLPQMDISTFPSQIFWLIITFGILYIFMWKFVIPNLRVTIEERTDKISNDINEAEKLKSQSEDILNKYESKMITTNQESAEIVAKSKKRSDSHIDQIKKDHKRKIKKMIDESKQRIAEQEKKAHAEIEAATLETIRSIAGKFINKLPPDDKIIKKLN